MSKLSGSSDIEEVMTSKIEDEGQLAIDVYQTEDMLVIIAPIAGVSQDNLEIAITDEIVSIRGTRAQLEPIPSENYFIQECYWGSFSRSYVLPVAVDPDAATATLQDGILTLRLPRIEKSKTRIVKINGVAE